MSKSKKSSNAAGSELENNPDNNASQPSQKASEVASKAASKKPSAKDLQKASKKPSQSSSEKDLHSGHRQRILKKYLDNGIGCLEEHEILEIFLFSIYPRINTNGISHRLINRFGSLAKVLDAEYDDLIEVEGVGATAASMLCFMKDFADIYHKNRIENVRLDTSEKAQKHCYEMLKNCHLEVVYVIFLDRFCNVLDEVELAKGTTEHVAFSMRDLLSKAIRTKCSNIILAHCHPDGMLAPSRIDIDVTKRIANSLRSINVELIDHIIVNATETLSMRRSVTIPEVW